MHFPTMTLLASVVSLGTLVGYASAQKPRPVLDVPNQAKAVAARQAQVDVPVSAITANMLTKVSDAKLWAAIQAHAAAAGKANRHISLGLYPAIPRNAQLVLTFDPKVAGVAKLLTSLFHKFDPKNPVYTVLDYRVLTPYKAGEFGNIWRCEKLANLQLPIAKEPLPAEKYKQGCCGTLTAMYSLVNRMGKKVKRSDVSEPFDIDGDGVTDYQVWKPQSLKDLWQASGDTGDRGMSVESVAKAHEYNPSGGASAASSTLAGTPTIFDTGNDSDNIQSPGDCASLKKLAEDINDRLMKDEDVNMYIYGADADGDWGHAAPIVSVTYIAGTPCILKIEVVRTSTQDDGDGFKEIPVNPGTAFYTMWSAGGETACVSANFPGSTIKKLTYDSFGR